MHINNTAMNASEGNNCTFHSCVISHFDHDARCLEQQLLMFRCIAVCVLSSHLFSVHQFA